MRKVLIITLYGNSNFGNKLQNYALQEYIKKVDKTVEVKTQKIKYEKDCNNIIGYYLYKTYYFIKRIRKRIDNREKKFIKFSNNYIKYTHDMIGTNTRKKIQGYNYYLYGSDQVWNPNGAGKSNLFIGLQTNNNIAYAASLSTNEVPEKLKEKYQKSLCNFKNISIREDKGKEIVEELTGRNDIEVLVDPTMLLTSEEWNKLSNRPKQLDNVKEDKYILNYFLGELSEARKKEIERIAKENNCHIINILDKNDPFYVCGPSEFLYLEKHAFLICTDSFHSSVFAILYNRPFIIFEREDKLQKMNSRIDTLLSKFKLKNRRYNGTSITKENLEHDYAEAYKILEEERKKSKEFLEKALDIKK